MNAGLILLITMCDLVSKIQIKNPQPLFLIISQLINEENLEMHILKF